MSAPLSHDERTAVIAMTRAGESARTIAERLGVTERTVVRIRRACGVSQPCASRLSDAEVALARRLLEDGASYKEVARTLGRDDRWLRHRLPGYGWTYADSGLFGHLRERYPTLLDALGRAA